MRGGRGPHSPTRRWPCRKCIQVIAKSRRGNQRTPASAHAAAAAAASLVPLALVAVAHVATPLLAFNVAPTPAWCGSHPCLVWRHRVLACRFFWLPLSNKGPLEAGLMQVAQPNLALPPSAFGHGTPAHAGVCVNTTRASLRVCPRPCPWSLHVSCVAFVPLCLCAFVPVCLCAFVPLCAF